MFCIDENNSIRYGLGIVLTDGETLFDSLTKLHDIAEYRKWSKQTVTDIWNGFAGTAGPFTDLKPCKCFRNRPYGLQRIWEAIQRLADGMMRPPLLGDGVGSIEEPEQSTTPILDEEEASETENCVECLGAGETCQNCGGDGEDCCEAPELDMCEACDGEGTVAVPSIAPIEKTKEPAMKPKSAARKPKKKAVKVKAKLEVKAEAGSSLAKLIKLASRKNGVSVDEAMAATGWGSPHTVRGRFSLLGSERGMTIERTKSETRGTVYRVA